MTRVTLDLTGLKCPLPALKTRKALMALSPGGGTTPHGIATFCLSTQRQASVPILPGDVPCLDGG
jgi:hypothetical protein